MVVSLLKVSESSEFVTTLSAGGRGRRVVVLMLIKSGDLSIS